MVMRRARNSSSHVRDAVHQRERHLLHRVAPASRKCAPATEIGLKRGVVRRAVLDRVGDQPDRRPRREDPRAARHVLLEDVVLDRARELARAARPACRPRRRTSRSRIAAVPLMVNEVEILPSGSVEEDLGLGEGVERHADLARPPPRRRGGRSRSRTASAGPAPPRGRSALAPAGTCSARSTPRRCRSPSTGGSSRAGPGSRREDAARERVLARRGIALGCGQSTSRSSLQAGCRLRFVTSGSTGGLPYDSIGETPYARNSATLTPRNESVIIAASDDPARRGGVRSTSRRRLSVVTIDRPEVRNAIGSRTLAELDAALDGAVGRRRGARGPGGGTARSSPVATSRARRSARTRTQAMAATMRRVLDRVATLPVPVIAALNGARSAGRRGRIVADIRIAADDIRIGFNQVTLGIMPAWGGAERLARVVGRRRACSRSRPASSTARRPPTTRARRHRRSPLGVRRANSAPRPASVDCTRHHLSREGRPRLAVTRRARDLEGGATAIGQLWTARRTGLRSITRDETADRRMKQTRVLRSDRWIPSDV